MLNLLKKASLKTKLLTLPVIFIAVSFVIFGVAVIIQITSSLNANEDEFIRSKADIFLSSIKEKQEALKANVKLTSIQADLYDGYFSYMAGDEEFILSFMQDLISLTDVNEIMLVNKDKTVSLRSGSKEKGDKLPYGSLDAIVKTDTISDRRGELSKIIKAAIVKDDNGVSIIAAGPILDVDSVVGAIVFVKKLDKHFLDGLKESGMNKYELQLVSKDSVIASTLNDQAFNQSIFNDNSEQGVYYDSVNAGDAAIKFAYKSLLGEAVYLGVGFDTSANIAAKRSVLLTNIVLGILCTLILFILIYSVTNEIIKAVNNVVGAADAIANHDLAIADITVDSEDEIAALSTSLNKMKGTLSSFVTEVQELSVNVSAAAEEMSASIEEISTSCQDISNDAGMQANEVNKSNSALEDLSKLAGTILTNTNKASEISLSTKTAAHEGNVAVKNTIKGILEIESSSKKIQTIIDVITDISSQTNLLALNAAIEAAKAGEQGKGFAVVADEVRKLAEKSALSTKEIVSLIDQSNAKVSQGVKVAKRAEEALEKITTSIDAAVAIINGIAVSTDEQNDKIKVVNDLSITLSEIAAKNSSSTDELSATTEQIASGANELSELSVRLSEFTSKFKV